MPDYGTQVERWFALKGVRPKCALCGHQEFGVGNLIPLHAPTPDDSGGGFAGYVGYTTLPLMCQNCGHIELFSADMMGLGPGGSSA